MPELFTRKTRMEIPADALFRFHADPSALERLTPPWEPIEILEPAPGVRDGNRGTFRVRLGPFRLRWTFEFRNVQEGRQFQDVQIRGPFKRWEHTHRFTPDGPSACWLEDQIEYELPAGVLGRWLASGMVRRRLGRLFEYRHRLTAEIVGGFNLRPRGLKEASTLSNQKYSPKR